MAGLDAGAIQPHLEPTADVVRCQGWHVYIRLRETGLPMAEIGRRVMCAERVLREQVDPRIEVFLEPMQDRNQIRRFRGVTVE